MMQYEIWKLNDDYYKVYTDSLMLLKRVKKHSGIEETSATYMKKGKEFAWDIVVPSKGINAVKKIFKDYEKK